ncbi:MAG: hypothetical protein K8R60_23575 [Burkholderiales bacterium]|nr:hypothetical protein [Burkholderiales bacterium]
MDIAAELALAKQAFEQLSALCDPAAITQWQANEFQRTTYVRLAETVIAAVDRLLVSESRHLYADGRIASIVPEHLLSYVRETLEPREADLWVALGHLDPEGQFLREIMQDVGRPMGLNGGIRRTFQHGIDQVVELIDRNPDIDFEGSLFPDAAYEFLDSKLIQFDPDSWLDRLSHLSPIRLGRPNLSFPSHLRFRLDEVYRAYAFGCWLSVLSLTRAVLEYALLDNASRLGFERESAPDRQGIRRTKRLVELVADYAVIIPSQREPMDRLRAMGNDYLHPKNTPDSKASLLDRGRQAQDAIALLCEVLEAVYLAGREGKTERSN